MSNHDFYELLGVTRAAGKKEIKKAFYRLALEFHPDKNGDKAEAADQFKKINEAYQTLSDPEKKFKYDQLDGAWSPVQKAQYVFFLLQKVSITKIKLNEEVEVSFAFPSDGRFFKREKFNGWFLSSGPIVEHKEIIYEGKLIKQTQLKYVLSAQVTGTISIPSAAISIHTKRITGEALDVTVEANCCYFKAGEVAGDDPYKITLFQEKKIKTDRFIKTIRQEHIVLIPRSKTAFYVHTNWKRIELITKILGSALLYYSGVFLIMAIALSFLFSFLLKLIYFKLKEVEMPLENAIKYPLIKSYMQQGYKLGIDGIEWPWKIWHNEKLKNRILKN